MRHQLTWAAAVALAAVFLASCDRLPTDSRVDAPQLALVVGSESILFTSFQSAGPKVDGDLAAWIHHVDGEFGWKVAAYDFANSTVFEVGTLGSSSAGAYSVSGNRIAWIDRDDQVHLLERDFTTGTSSDVLVGRTAYGVSLSGDRLALTMGYPSYGVIACRWDGQECGSEVTISPTGVGVGISGDMVLFHEGTLNQRGIKLFDLSQGTVHTLVGSGYRYATDISGNVVTWVDVIVGPPCGSVDVPCVNDVYICEWNGSTCPSVLLAGGESAMEPKVSGTRVVWRTPAPIGSGGVGILHLWDGALEETTSDFARGWIPDISGDRIVYAQGPVGDQSIMLFQVEEITDASTEYVRSRVDEFVADGLVEEGVASVLHRLLGQAGDAKAKGNLNGAEGVLTAFIRLVSARSGPDMPIDPEAGLELIDLAEAIIVQELGG